MGMAASQARFLALAARKSNCEYEGQQINQARTVLANQSANLFNQMLGLTVPVPPSTQDYTKTQYSYNDGLNGSTISDWKQLSTADPDYNYVVTHYYYTDKYTGSLKKLSDPQVLYSTSASQSTNMAVLENLAKLKSAYDKSVADVKQKQADLSAAQLALSQAQVKAAKLDSYNGSVTPINVSNTPTITLPTITITDSSTPPNTYTYTQYSSLAKQSTVKDAVDKLRANNAYTPDPNDDALWDTDPTSGQKKYNYSNIFDDGSGNIAFWTDLSALTSGSEFKPYPISEINKIANEVADASDAVNKAQKAYDDAVYNSGNALANYEKAVSDYSTNYNEPISLGNCKLTRLDSLTEDQETELRQIVADMTEQGIDCNILGCFDSSGNYIGGVYSFVMNGNTYYTTLADLNESYNSNTGVQNNDIDGQIKLTYYNASYISTKIEKTEKALVETDGNGRFTSIKFEDDSVVYTLKMETVTDDKAYEDAMNQYYYENAKYDKMVQDINAKTSIIQQQDRTLELRLKQLDTEQNALKTEMDAVKGVIKDNVDKTFNTFGG